MSATGLDVFDKTLHVTNLWLKEISEDVGPDRQVAWKVLSTVLHKLRDRLPIELSAHLGSQLPLLIRGVYYDQYKPSAHPSEHHNAESFTAEVGKWLSDIRPVDPETAVLAVFKVLSRHLPEGQITKVQHALPKSLRQRWESVEVKAQPVESVD